MPSMTKKKRKRKTKSDLERIREAGPNGTMTVQEVADIRGYDTSTIYKWGKGHGGPEGFPRCLQKGGRWLWLRDEIEAFYAEE